MRKCTLMKVLPYISALKQAHILSSEDVDRLVRLCKEGKDEAFASEIYTLGAENPHPCLDRIGELLLEGGNR